MRTKVIIILSLLLCAHWHHVCAQDIGRCEYWIDSDYANCTSVEVFGNTVNISVPMDGYKAGLHFFNFRAIDGEGNVGNLMRTLFYLPEAKQTDTNVTFHETWFDDDYANRILSKSDNNPSLSLDLGDMRHGLHFFNFRAIDGEGNVGNLMRTLFYLPETDTPDVAGYEYWLDNDSVGSVKVDGRDCNLNILVDVSTLSEGEHTFNFRAKNSLGQWGAVFTEVFTLDELSDIEMIKTDDKPFDVYNLSGVIILKEATKQDLRRLPNSIYIVNGRKVIVRNN